MTPYGFIYITTNLINGKRYLGMCAYHRNNSNTYLGSGKALRRAIKKYGSQSFKRETIEECSDKASMIAAEIRWITQLGCVSDTSWYNINAGGYATNGFSGKTHSEETKAKMRQNYRRPVSAKTQELFRENGKARAFKLREFAKEHYANGGVSPKAKPVTYDGVTYPSMLHCIKATGIHFYKLKKLLTASQLGDDRYPNGPQTNPHAFHSEPCPTESNELVQHHPAP